MALVFPTIQEKNPRKSITYTYITVLIMVELLVLLYGYIASIKPREQLKHSEHTSEVLQQISRLGEIIKLSVYHLQPIEDKPPTQELNNVFKKWKETQQNLAKTSTGETKNLYNQADKAGVSISNAVENLLFSMKYLDKNASQAFVLQMVDHERDYIEAMNKIVAVYGKDAVVKMQENLSFILFCVIGFSLINLLIGIFIFRPLGRMVDRYVSKIEDGNKHIAESDNLLNEAQKTANLGSFSLDFRTNTMQWSAHLYRLLNTSPEQLPSTDIRTLLKTIAPEDQDKLEKALNEAEDVRLELKVPQSDSIKQVLYQGTVVKDAQGVVIQQIGTLLDITTQKESELRLREQDAALRQLNENLEKLVEERTLALSKALEELKSAQSQLVNSEKMVSLGLLVAGIAHELNTPISAIKSSIENIDETLPRTLENAPQYLREVEESTRWMVFFVLSEALRPQDILTTRARRQIKLSLIKLLEENEIDNAEKLSETFILCGLYQNAEDYIPFLKMDNVENLLPLVHNFGRIRAALDNIKLASDKCQKINLALKNYSRQQYLKDEVVATDLNKSIETILTIYQNQIKHGVQVVYPINTVPEILAYEDELNQVWTNLIQNAIYAMDGVGVLSIDVQEHEEEIVVKIADSGKGIPKDVLAHIFEPFFTTKPKGEGTGLGLDICKKIIDKHEGRIEVESEEGRTVFSVYLPKRIPPTQGLVEKVRQ